MSNEYGQDVSEAITSLSRAILDIERQSADLEAERADLTRKRKNTLSQTIERLLPAVTATVLCDLRVAVPGFVDASVEKAFKPQNKMFGIFRRSGNDQTLTSLQARLASYLDENKFGDLKNLDAEQAALLVRIYRLWRNQKEMLDILKMMKHAEQKKTFLSADLSTRVSAISARIKQHETSCRRTGSARDKCDDYSDANSSSREDGSDLLLYLATDFPTSVRTAMLSAIQSTSNIVAPGSPVESTRTNTNVFGGDDGGYSNTDVIHSSSGFTNDHGMSAGAIIGAGVGVAAAAVAGLSIATDDSLGRFS